MKRKQLSLSEIEINIIVDALRTQWWMRYNPEVEENVVLHHKLFDRLVDAQNQVSTGPKETNS
tara:strand:- start:863 stop:1051 length:189 start_codon:yes stop_codon:yes gene_type:complete